MTYATIPTPDEVAVEVERIEYERNTWARNRYRAWSNYDADSLPDEDEPIVPDYQPEEEYL